MNKTILCALCTALAACGSSTPAKPAPTATAPTQAASATAETSQPASAESGSGERRFGAAPKLTTDPLPVQQVMAAPDAHLGKTIKCEGTVGRVCQAAGCWLELQASGGGEGLRVPMANHAFFIPKDAVGKLAVVEGELHRADLPAEQREHYASEGMKAVGPLSLEATSVVLR